MLRAEFVSTVTDSEILSGRLADTLSNDFLLSKGTTHMANANTFAGVYTIPGPVSATETCVAAYNAIGGNTTGGFTQQAIQTGTTRQFVGVPADVSGGIFDGRPFKMRVVAQTQSTVASNFTVNCYWSAGVNTNTTTLTGDILVIGSGAVAVASKPATVFMEATLQWDSSLQSLTGFWNGAAGQYVITSTGGVIIKSSAAETATDPIATLQASTGLLNFFVTFTNSGAVTSTKLIEFALDRI